MDFEIRVSTAGRARVTDVDSERNYDLLAGQARHFAMEPGKWFHVKLLAGFIHIVNLSTKLISIEELTAEGESLEDALSPKQSRRFDRKGSTYQLEW